MSDSPIRVLVVGLGNMGLSHAQAYHADPGFEIVGLANRSEMKLPPALQAYPRFGSFEEGLTKTKPDLVSLNTRTDSHADYALRAVRDRASALVKDTIGCSVTISLVPPGTVPRSEGGKLARVGDTRAQQGAA